jgi:hypothetical protein
MEIKLLILGALISLIVAFARGTVTEQASDRQSASAQ